MSHGLWESYQEYQNSFHSNLHTNFLYHFCTFLHTFHFVHKEILLDTNVH